LDSIQSAVLNEKAFEAEQNRIDQIKADFSKVLSRARELYGYVPLLAEGEDQDSFVKSCLSDPAVQRDVPEEDARGDACLKKWQEKVGLPESTPLQRIEFRNKYTEAMDRLYSQLRCGGLPSANEVGAMKTRRENELAEGRPTPPGDPRTIAGVLTSTGLYDDPASRAAIAKALSFLCYCVPFNEEKPPDIFPSLSFVAEMKQTGTVTAPEPFDVWRAQVEYWIQKDVVDAIVAVNEAAGQAARTAGQDPWVGTMSVKEVTSIRFGTPFYVPPEGGLVMVAKPEDYTAAVPPGTGESVFTGSRSGPQFEVVQFTLKLVMDQRDIPLLVEKMCNNRFHTLVRTAYKVVPPNRELKGKIYGAEPAVRVVLDFETAMLGEVFRPLMPAQVCEFYQIQCPQPAAQP
jgi:hypothetical protein